MVMMLLASVFQNGRIAWTAMMGTFNKMSAMLV